MNDRRHAAERGAGNPEAGKVWAMLIRNGKEDDARAHKCAERGKAEVAENHQDASDEEKRGARQHTARHTARRKRP